MVRTSITSCNQIQKHVMDDDNPSFITEELSGEEMSLFPGDASGALDGNYRFQIYLDKIFDINNR